MALLRRLSLVLMRTEIFSADFSNLAQIRDFAAQAARDAGLEDKDIYAVQLAVDEAASNIIEHAYRDIPNGQLEITCSQRTDGLAIILRDYGRPFDPKQVRKPNLSAKLSRRSIGGLGLYMIHNLMDDVNYQTTPDAGNVLTLVKKKSSC